MKSLRTLWLIPVCCLVLVGLPLLALPALGAGEPVPAAKLAELAQVRADIERLGLRWQADVNPVALLDREQWLAMCGTPPPVGPITGPSFHRAGRDLPVSLDWRDNGGNWVTGVRNQGSCGSCWIFGAVAAFES